MCWNIRGCVDWLIYSVIYVYESILCNWITCWKYFFFFSLVNCTYTATYEPTISPVPSAWWYWLCLELLLAVWKLSNVSLSRPEQALRFDSPICRFLNKTLIWDEGVCWEKILRQANFTNQRKLEWILWLQGYRRYFSHEYMFLRNLFIKMCHFFPFLISSHSFISWWCWRCCCLQNSPHSSLSVIGRHLNDDGKMYTANEWMNIWEGLSPLFICLILCILTSIPSFSPIHMLQLLSAKRNNHGIVVVLLLILFFSRRKDIII